MANKNKATKKATEKTATKAVTPLGSIDNHSGLKISLNLRSRSYFGIGEPDDMKIWLNNEHWWTEVPKGLTDEEALENMFERINVAIGIFLDAKFPNAEPIQNGVEVYYAITYETYEENMVRNHFTVTYKCVGIGEFEYISGPELVE